MLPTFGEDERRAPFGAQSPDESFAPRSGYVLVPATQPSFCLRCVASRPPKPLANVVQARQRIERTRRETRAAIDAAEAEFRKAIQDARGRLPPLAAGA